MNRNTRHASKGTVTEQVTSYGNKIISALVSDLSNPILLDNIRELVVTGIIKITGFNINSPFIRPLFDAKYDDFEEYMVDKIGILNLIKSVTQNKESVETASNVIKEGAIHYFDDFTEKLKKAVEEKQDLRKTS